MKFTSVILALSAVVAMVQAAPLPQLPVALPNLAGGASPLGAVGSLPVVGGVSGGIAPLGGVVASVRETVDDSVAPTVENLVGGEIDVPALNKVNKRDLTKAIPADTSTIQNTIHTVADQVQIDLENLVTVEVNAYIQARLHIANIASIDAEVPVAIRAVIRAAIGDIYPGLEATIDGLVNKAVTAADKVNVNELVPKVISLIHDLITKVVVTVDVEVLAKVYAEVKVLDIVEIPVNVDVDAKLGLNVEVVVGQLLANLPVADNLVKNLVQ
ncbi:MAG: hypothetical protein J3Q66DRAFT_436844 [Benniella sp.]|nr:MAG: hypothetical protein J3Q66DRAFT_436844 [Benniella sp.]